mmetsp:Transcript_71357/g.190561  ORF Transcript_71357/g.190561 Transcript_71357/m.190561 type:complete len:229 (-) Transcript_71357:37-723(-)
MVKCMVPLWIISGERSARSPPSSSNSCTVSVLKGSFASLSSALPSMAIWCRLRSTSINVYRKLSRCRSFLPSMSSSTVSDLRFALMRTGTIVTTPSIPPAIITNSTEVGPSGARKEQGTQRYSNSPGYWLSSEMHAPRSIVPVTIRSTMGIGPDFTPEYIIATSFLAVVLKKPYSMKPTLPCASALRNDSGNSVIPPVPRKSSRPVGSFITRAICAGAGEQAREKILR